MKAEIIAIGTELVSGQSLDTNSQWLSQRLGMLGIPVHFHTSLGDDLAENVAVFRIAIGRADLILDQRRARPDPGRPDPRGPRRPGRGRPGGGRRLARSHRGPVRPAESRDVRAEPGPGPLPRRGRAAPQRDRHRARDRHEGRQGVFRLPARRPQ